MPRYYFHIRDNDLLRTDPEGEEFSSVEKAIEEAALAARELLAEKVRNGDLVDGQVFEIADEHGTVVRTFPLKSVLRLDK
jgi:ribosomal protein S1